MTAEDEPAPRFGLRLGWALLGLMIVGLVVASVTVFGVRPGGSVSGRPTTPTMVGGGGTLTESRSAPTLSARSSTTATPTPPGSAVNVAGVGGKRAIDCANNEVTVSGVNNEVVLTGHCRRVDVSGVENTVTIETADAIDVSGMNNRVTFQAGTPELNNSGIGNTLARS